MLTNYEIRSGTGFQWWNRTEFRVGNPAKVSHNFTRGQNRQVFWEWEEDFIAVSSSVPGNFYDSSAAGSPSATSLNADGGQVQLELAATDEAEWYGPAWTNKLQISPDRFFTVEQRWQIPTALTTAQRFIVGFAGSLAGVGAGNLGGFIGGVFYLNASMVLNVATYNTAGDVAETQALDITLDADKFYWFKQQYNEGVLEYWLGDKFGCDGGKVYSVSVDWDTDHFQPVGLLGKTGGVTQPTAIVDYMYARGMRGE